MPIYEYRRPNGTTFEVMQKMADDPLTHDPESGVPVERVFHPVAVHFKGKGFYNTDYGTRNRQRETAAAAEKSSSEKSSTEKSSTEKSSSEKSGGDKAKSDSSSSNSSGTTEKKSDKPAEKKSEAKPKKDSKPVAGKS